MPLLKPAVARKDPLQLIQFLLQYWFPRSPKAYDRAYAIFY